MSSMKHLRFLERFMLLAFVVSVGMLSKFYVGGRLEWNDLFAGVGILVLILAILIFIQKRFDALLSLTMSQTDYIQSDAFSSLYDRSPAAYLTINTEGGIVGCNPAAIKLLEGETGNINSTNFFNLLEAGEGEDSTVLLGKMSAGMTMKDVEVRLNTLKGTELWATVSVNAYRNENERLVSLVDITAQKNVDTAKSEFVALATHQLRTPIAAIRWNVELLEKNMGEGKNEKQERYFKKINRNVFRMINLINDFLSVSKLEMGTFASSAEDVNLTEFFSSIVEEFSEKITEKGIILSRSDNPSQLNVKIDSRLLHIVVSNLVSNAVKYLNANGALAVSYELKGASLEIIVADNGIGIPEPELNKLFIKFFRASNAQSHHTEGTGLGLYVVKQSVEQLGGDIQVASAADKGAKFVVTIPVSVSPAN